MSEPFGRLRARSPDLPDKSQTRSYQRCANPYRLEVRVERREPGRHLLL